MIRKTFIETERGLVARVTFILPNSTWADTIYLVGDFNGWNHSSHPFQRGREGTWTLTLDLEAGRCYQFRYLRDGEWINDSQADGFVWTDLSKNSRHRQERENHDIPGGTHEQGLHDLLVSRMLVPNNHPTHLLPRPGIWPDREGGAAALPFHVECGIAYTT